MIDDTTQDESILDALTFTFVKRFIKINETIVDFEVIKRPKVALIIPVTENKEIVFINQFRAPVNQFVFELPAGKINPSEEMQNAAKRELHEETGYLAGRILKIFDFYTAPHFSDEMISVFLATKLVYDVKALEPKEFIHNYLIPIEEVKKSLYSLNIIDSKTLTSINYYLTKFNI